jgi:Tfp pilus assembly protein PilF
LTAIALARRSPYLIAGWLWYVIALLPVIGLLQTGAQAMADRYSYIPSIGVYVAVVWSGGAVLGGQRGSIGVVAAVVVIGILGVLARTQVHVWSGSSTLYAHAVRCTDQNWIMHLKLGTEFELSQQLEEAHSQFILAAQARPKSVDAQFKVADILAQLRRFTESKAAFRHVLTLDPDDVHALNNLAWLLASFPQNRAEDAAQALRLAQRAVELTNHQEISFLDTLASAYAANGQLDEAIRVARSARDLARQRGDDRTAAQLDAAHMSYLRGEDAARSHPASTGNH